MSESTQSQPTPGSENRARLASGRSSEFLAFKLGAENYGMDILCVQEIRSYEEPTRMANTPEFIKGVMNLRGVIVPIIDMRIKFGLADPVYDTLTVVIVINVGGTVLGMVVDGVSDVVSLSDAEMQAVPEMAAGVISNHVRAIGSIQDRMLIILDIEALMVSSEMGLVSQTLQ